MTKEEILAKLKEIGKGDLQECTWEELHQLFPSSPLVLHALAKEDNHDNSTQRW